MTRILVSNIFDPVEQTLDQSVFKGEDPKPQIVNFIRKLYCRAFEKAFGNLDCSEYLSLYLTGSLTTFQYSDTSDVDISVFPDYNLFGRDPNEVRKDLIALSIDKLDGTFLPGSQHPLQFFVVPPDVSPDDLYKPGLRSAWSFSAKSWEVPPERNRSHDVQTELPEAFRRASEMADKMTQALDKDPEVARDMWHQIHKKRQLDQRAGLGDFSEGNIVYKWLLHEGLFDRIKDELGEYIAKTAIQTELQPHQPLRFLAESYMQQANLPYNPPSNYASVDPQQARTIAQLYDQMEHNPNDPAVQQSYRAMINETKAQYDHLTNNGYQFEFYPQTHDPYPDSPHQAVKDIYDNKHLYVYPTSAGFGSINEQHDHPLLANSGVRWNGVPVTHNDLFRAVHDVFGHAKEGVGFRASGEENAWRQHSAMYSDLARPAMTAETRGQNSWVNYGPHGEANQIANQTGTVYADQKAGLLPEWVSSLGQRVTAKVSTDLMMQRYDDRGRDDHYGAMPFIYHVPTEQAFIGGGDTHSRICGAHDLGTQDLDDGDMIFGRVFPDDEYGTDIITYGDRHDEISPEKKEILRDLASQYDRNKAWPARVAENLMDRVTMKVIYDFEKDRIYLGTQADQKGMANTKIIGEYNDKKGVATLYHGESNWLNTNYFYRLWHHSFPNRALHNVIIQSGQDPNNKIKTRNPFKIPKKGTVSYETAFVYLGKPFDELLIGGSEHSDLIFEFIDRLMEPMFERGKVEDPFETQQEIMTRLMTVPMLYGHIGTHFRGIGDEGRPVYVIHSDFIQGKPDNTLEDRALNALEQKFPNIRPDTSDESWYSGG